MPVKKNSKSKAKAKVTAKKSAKRAVKRSVKKTVKRPAVAKKIKKSSAKPAKKNKSAVANPPKIRLPKAHIHEGLTRIKVIGIGGAGGSIVSRMREKSRMRGVEYIAVNTDAQDLNHTNVHRRIHIGKALTKGLGTGMNPDLGKQAAEENRSELGEAMEGADIVFLVSGFGGGSGTGGTPVLAEIAREKGILTIAVVTKPFSFEGSKRAAIAQEGISRLKDLVDALVVIPNDRVFSLINKDTSVIKAFSYIDDIIRAGIEAIADVINSPGIINVDFSDVKAVLKDSGPSLIGVGVAAGQDRAIKAVQAAINSPLIETSVDGAKGILFCIAGSRDLKMAEIHDVAKAVVANLDPTARIIFGAYYDSRLKDKSLKVTVIATGFNGFTEGGPLPNLFESVNQNRPNDSLFDLNAGKPASAKNSSGSGGSTDRPANKAKPKKEKSDDKDPWDIPAFLRKKKR